MKIILADMTTLEAVFQITKQTIQQIYPKYYPMGAVAFFLNYHSREKIAEDISNKKVFIVQVNQKCVGTITINNNEIGRLFVLPNYQKQGIGSFMIDFAEELIFKKYESVSLDSSVPGERMYKNREYVVTSNCSILTDNGDVLYYNEMIKKKGKDK